MRPDCVEIFMTLCLWLHPAPAHVDTIQEIITRAAVEFSVDSGTLLRVSFCESTFRPSVVGDSGLAVGLFQFHLPTWNENAPRLGYTADLRAEPEAAARVAASMFSRGMSGRWTCK